MADGNITVEVSTQAAQAELARLRAALDQKHAEYEDLKACAANNARNLAREAHTWSKAAEAYAAEIVERGVMRLVPERTVAALCVAPNSGYKAMPGVECYDQARDVRNFAGGMPVVAHPPCRAWERLHRASGEAAAR